MATGMQEAAREAVSIRDGLAHVCHTRSEEMAQAARAPNYSEDWAAHMIRALPTVLADAELVVWTLEMYNLAVRGANEAFDDIPARADLLSLVPAPQLWFLADGTVGLSGAEEAFALPRGSRCDTLLIVPGGDDKVFGLFPVYCFALPESDRLPTLRSVKPLQPGKPLHSTQSLFAACLEFMTLKLAAREPVRLPRPDRRRMKREGRDEPLVSVVQLRRREPTERHAESEREYHHRWVVKGHWRRLHEPRKKDGSQVTFVDSYVKGPEGAPLLPPRETVYAVTR